MGKVRAATTLEYYSTKPISQQSPTAVSCRNFGREMEEIDHEEYAGKGNALWIKRPDSVTPSDDEKAYSEERTVKIHDPDPQRGAPLCKRASYIALQTLLPQCERLDTKLQLKDRCVRLQKYLSDIDTFHLPTLENLQRKILRSQAAKAKETLEGFLQAIPSVIESWEDMQGEFHVIEEQICDLRNLVASPSGDKNWIIIVRDRLSSALTKVRGLELLEESREDHKTNLEDFTARQQAFHQELLTLEQQFLACCVRGMLTF